MRTVTTSGVARQGASCYECFWSVILAIATGPLIGLLIACVSWLVSFGGERWPFGFVSLWIVWWTIVSLLALNYFVSCVSYADTPAVPA